MEPETYNFMEHFLNAEESPSPLQITNNGLIYYLGFIIAKSALCSIYFCSQNTSHFTTTSMNLE